MAEAQNTQNTRPVEETPSSPYYLHPNENPALVLVSPVLSGSNYHSWHRAMKMALLSKNKLAFVDGSIPIPARTDNIYTAWQRCNTMVLPWLMRSLSESIAQSVIWHDNAMDVWKDLKDRFSQGDSLRISDLQKEIYSLQQGDLSVNDYFTKLKILWDEFINLRPVPVCSCNPTCNCDALTTVRKYQDSDYVIRFLTGLNDNFSTVKSQILLLDPMPTINRVFALVIQQERQLGHYESVSHTLSYI